MGAALPPTQALAEHAFHMRACAAAFVDAANVMRVGLQQTYTKDDLLKRFHGLTWEQISGLFASHCGLRFERGAHVVVHLDHVLAVTAAVRTQMAGA